MHLQRMITPTIFMTLTRLFCTKRHLIGFAQFFISPLLNAEFVERERNAVDSEYYARRTDDFRRTWSARKRVFNPLSIQSHSFQ